MQKIQLSNYLSIRTESGRNKAETNTIALHLYKEFAENN